MGSHHRDAAAEEWRHLPVLSSSFVGSAIYCTVCEVYVNGRSQYLWHIPTRKHNMLYRRTKRASEREQQEEEARRWREESR